MLRRGALPKSPPPSPFFVPIERVSGSEIETDDSERLNQTILHQLTEANTNHENESRHLEEDTNQSSKGRRPVSCQSPCPLPRSPVPGYSSAVRSPQYGSHNNSLRVDAILTCASRSGSPPPLGSRRNSFLRPSDSPSQKSSESSQTFSSPNIPSRPDSPCSLNEPVPHSSSSDEEQHATENDSETEFTPSTSESHSPPFRDRPAQCQNDNQPPEPVRFRQGRRSSLVPQELPSLARLRPQNRLSRSFSSGDLRSLLETISSFEEKLAVAKADADIDLQLFLHDLEELAQEENVNLLKTITLPGLEGIETSPMQVLESLRQLATDFVQLSSADLSYERCQDFVSEVQFIRPLTARVWPQMKFATRFLFIISRCCRIAEYLDHPNGNGMPRFDHLNESNDMDSDAKSISRCGSVLSGVESPVPIMRSDSTLMTALNAHVSEWKDEVEQERGLLSPEFYGPGLIARRASGVVSWAGSDADPPPSQRREGYLLCRICEEMVSSDLLAEHSRHCVIEHAFDVQPASCDESLQEIVNDINGRIVELIKMRPSTSIQFVQPRLQNNSSPASMMSRAVLDKDDIRKVFARKTSSGNSSRAVSPTTAAIGREVDLMEDLKLICTRAQILTAGSAGAVRNCSLLLEDCMNLTKFGPPITYEDASLEDPFRSDIGRRIEMALKLKLSTLKATATRRDSIERFSRASLDQILTNVRSSPGSPSVYYSGEEGARKEDQGGTSIKEFDIIKPISKGAYGRVFLVRKRKTGDVFAMKVLRKRDMVRKKQVEHVRAERNILAYSCNPFVVKLYYSFQSKRHLYMVMEYLPGGDLFSLLRTLGSLEEDFARMYIAETVLALGYLHSNGIVHRDLKPDNMLINKDGHIKLTDFGLSSVGLAAAHTVQLELEPWSPSEHTRAVNSPASLSSQGSGSNWGTFDEDNLLLDAWKSSIGGTSQSQPYLLRPSRSAPKVLPSHTGNHNFLKSNSERRPSPDKGRRLCLLQAKPASPKVQGAFGTPDYLAPEVLQGREHGPEVDWWSLGCIAYELLIGSPPFSSDSPDGIFDNILHRRLAWPDEPLLSAEARDFIERLLELEPTKRLGHEGVSEIMAHPFFSGILWDEVLRKPGPFVPQTEGLEDTSYFDPRKEMYDVSSDLSSGLHVVQPRGSSDLEPQPRDISVDNRPESQGLSVDVGTERDVTWGEGSGARDVTSGQSSPKGSGPSSPKQNSSPGGEEPHSSASSPKLSSHDFEDFSFRNLSNLLAANQELLDGSSLDLGAGLATIPSTRAVSPSFGDCTFHTLSLNGSLGAEMRYMDNILRQRKSMVATPSGEHGMLDLMSPPHQLGGIRASRRPSVDPMTLAMFRRKSVTELDPQQLRRASDPEVKKLYGSPKGTVFTSSLSSPYRLASPRLPAARPPDNWLPEADSKAGFEAGSVHP